MRGSRVVALVALVGLLGCDAILDMQERTLEDAGLDANKGPGGGTDAAGVLDSPVTTDAIAHDAPVVIVDGGVSVDGPVLSDAPAYADTPIVIADGPIMIPDGPIPPGRDGADSLDARRLDDGRVCVSGGVVPGCQDP